MSPGWGEGVEEEFLPVLYHTRKTKISRGENTEKGAFPQRRGTSIFQFLLSRLKSESVRRMISEFDRVKKYVYIYVVVLVVWRVDTP